MGSLTNFNLKEFIDKHGLTHFVETGSYKGDSLNFACGHNFEQLYSIELLPKYYEHCLNRFKSNQKVSLINDNSINGLKSILGKLNNTLFWLDAHLPNFYDVTFNSNYIENKNILIPLEEELKEIVKNKNILNDVFIIDDLRIYEKNNFEAGNWEDVVNLNFNTDFIYELFEKTHNITKLYENEGYIVCEPKI